MRCRLVASAVSLAAVLLITACGDDGEGGLQPEDPFTVTFPTNFLWGTANSAYQSEGNFKPDGGRVESNWSHWEDLNNILTGEKNDRGADFYLQFDADFAVAQADGHNAIRIGLEWARIEPEEGVFDQAEMDHYIDVIDAARARGLNVVLTLYHWVVPVWVADPTTGLDLFAAPLNQDLWDRFDEFVRFVIPQIADRVDYYVPFNEPFAVASEGYFSAVHPPGKFFDIPGATNFLFNVAFMHARAYRTIRSLDTRDADSDGKPTMIGIAEVATPFYPVDPNSPGDVRGADSINYIVNDLFTNALIYGDVDVNLDHDTEDQNTVPPEGHYSELQGTLDYIGINYYGPMRVTAIGPPLYGLPTGDVRDYNPLLPHNGLGQEINAPDFRVILDRYAQYGLPLLITENGTDTREFDQRGMYLMEHIYQIGKAIKDGLPIVGYLQWSLTDNFEWESGYSSRFGLYELDYTQPGFPRIRTDGADVMQEIIAGNRIDRALYDKYVADRYPSDQRPR